MDALVVKTNLSLYISVILLIWANVYIQGITSETDYMTKMQNVKERILKNYDKYIRPTKGTNQTTTVFSRFVPKQILHLDEETALLTMDSDLTLSWNDPRLTWNSSEFDGYLALPRELLWIPDFSILNSNSQQVDPIQEVLLIVYKTGTVYWTPPIHTQTTCPAASKVNYPNDKVSCLIKFGSWFHDGWNINYLHSSEVEMSEFLDINPRWKVEHMMIFRRVKSNVLVPEPYITIELTVDMKRRLIPEIKVPETKVPEIKVPEIKVPEINHGATRAPCILVMILMLSIFWLPPDSSQKLLLGGILFLVLNVLLVFVAKRTHHPLSTVQAESFLQTAMNLVATTLLLQVFVVIKIGALSGPSRPPKMVMQFLTGPLGKYACLRSAMSEERMSLQLKEDASTVENFSARDEWKLFAAAIDRVLFVVMLVITITVHHL